MNQPKKNWISVKGKRKKSDIKKKPKTDLISNLEKREGTETTEERGGGRPWEKGVFAEGGIFRTIRPKRPVTGGKSGEGGETSRGGKAPYREKKK